MSADTTHSDPVDCRGEVESSSRSGSANLAEDLLAGASIDTGAVGLLGLITTVTYRLTAVPGLLRIGLTAVGRTALSCHVFQNLVAAVLCYGWGFGLAARFADARPWWVIGAWTGICALFMTLSVRWLCHFEGDRRVASSRGGRPPPGVADETAPMR